MDWHNILYEPKTGRMRGGWRASLFLLVAVSLTALLLAIMGAFTENAAPLPADYTFLREMLMQEVAILSAFLAAGIWALRALDRLPASTLGLSPRGPWLRVLGLGFILGFGLITMPVFSLWLAGRAHLGWQYHGRVDLLVMATALGCMLIFSLAEELVFRGYLFQTLLRSIGPLATLFIMSALFAFVHLGNPNVTLLGVANVLVAGAVFGMLYLRMGTLWLPIGLHAGWNFAQIFYGLPLSGLHFPFTLPVSGALSGPAWLTGGAFGLEGSLTASVVLLSVLAVISYARRGLPLESAWWEWRELSTAPLPPAPWNFRIGSRTYQWKLLGEEGGE